MQGFGSCVRCSEFIPSMAFQGGAVLVAKRLECACPDAGVGHGEMILQFTEITASMTTILWPLQHHGLESILPFPTTYFLQSTRRGTLGSVQRLQQFLQAVLELQLGKVDVLLHLTLEGGQGQDEGKGRCLTTIGRRQSMAPNPSAVALTMSIFRKSSQSASH